MNVSARCRRCLVERSVEVNHVVVALPPGPDELPAELLVTCGTCGTTSVLRIPRPVAAALLACGAASLPAQDVSPLSRPHPEAPPADAPPLTRDDLLDLHEQLADGTLLRCLLGEAS